MAEQATPPANNTRQQNVFTSVFTFYDNEFSAMKLGYRTDGNWHTIGFLEVAPIFSDQKGAKTEKGVQKYNYEAKVFCPIYVNVAQEILKVIKTGFIGKIEVSANKTIEFAKPEEFDGYENYAEGVMIIISTTGETASDIYHLLKDESDKFLFTEYIKNIIITAVNSSGHIVHAAQFFAGSKAGSNNSNKPTAPGPTRRGPSASNPPTEVAADESALDSFTGAAEENF